MPTTVFLNIMHSNWSSRDSAVDIATDYELDDRGIPVGSGIFAFPRRPNWLWGPPSLLIQWEPGSLSPGVKRKGRGADQSPAASA
jgi:hypothetical protein